MSVLKPRSRLVNFRLTLEEFQQLSDACVKQGARSISDFARGAVLRQIDEMAIPDAGTPDRERRMVEALDHVESRVLQLLRLVEGIRPAGPSGAQVLENLE